MDRATPPVLSSSPVNRQPPHHGPFAFKAVLLFLAALVFCSAVSAAPRRSSKKRPGPDAPVISRITIRGTDIFDTQLNPRLQRFPYTWINILHVRTKENIIRQELLFKVGDRLDPFLLRETERNLRALSFIRAARIVTFPQRDGTVALVVHANDSWTTEPQLNLGGINGVDETEIGFKEKNLFGLGKNIEFLHSEGKDFTRKEFDFLDPRLFGTRFQLRGIYSTETDGNARSIRLERPFFSADTRWSTRGYHERSVFEIEDFENNEEVSEFEQTKEVSEVGGGFKVGGGRDIVNHLGLRYRQENRWIEATPDTNPTRPLPPNRHFETIFVDFDSGKTDYVEMTHLEKMTRVEDLNLGPYFRMSPGYSPHVLTGRQNSAELDALFEKRFVLWETNVLQQALAYSGRDSFRRGTNERFRVEMKYYRRPTDYRTTVFNTRVNWGNDLDADNPIRLGADNGLRSHETDRFVGSKSWVTNIEERFFLIDELWNLLAVGAVVFADSGYAWPSGRPVSLSKMRTDIGTGLRFGLTRSSNEVVLRFDVAYRLQSDQRDDARWVFTFGSGQAF